MERLLREYTQNQEMVRNIGSHYYQIIYPVQLRQHKKMGISTREIGSSQVRKQRSTVCHSTFRPIKTTSDPAKLEITEKWARPTIRMCPLTHEHRLEIGIDWGAPLNPNINFPNVKPRKTFSSLQDCEYAFQLLIILVYIKHFHFRDALGVYFF